LKGRAKVIPPLRGEPAADGGFNGLQTRGKYMGRPDTNWHRRIDLVGLAALILTATTSAAGQERQAAPAGTEKANAAQWVKFSPEGARFSLSLPASPNEKTKNEDGGLKIHYYKLTIGPTEYQVVWFANVPYGMLHQAPLNVLFPRGLEDILKSAKKSMKQDFVTTRQEDIALSGYSGRETTMESAAGRIDAKCFLAGYDFVTLAVLHPKEEASAGDAKRFLDSLSLVVNPGQTSGVASGAGIGPGTAVDTRPVPLNRPRPNYTERARKNSVQGVIRLSVLIDVDGSVKDVHLITHLPDGLDEEAAKAARQLRFRPATSGGQPVKFWQLLEVEFNLREKR